VDEDVPRPVRVARDEVVGVAPERDDVAVGRDCRIPALVVGLVAGRVDADPLGGSRRAIVDEDVGGVVRVALDEIARVALEGDEPPVRGDGGTPGG